MEVAPGTGPIETKGKFGDVQLHVEWASPNPPSARARIAATAASFLMGMFEVQVIDSYQADTYADGQAGALYGQYPPLANASRPPGEWQTYDIAFRRPRFDKDGKLLEPARFTVIHNGILVQNNEELWGGTNWLEPAPYDHRMRSRSDRASGPWPQGPVPQYLAARAARAARASGRLSRRAEGHFAVGRGAGSVDRASTPWGTTRTQNRS